MSVAFDTAIRRVNSGAINRVMTWGLLALVPLGFGAVVLTELTSQAVTRTVFMIGGLVFVALYVTSLNRVMQPAEIALRVVADARGLEAADRWLARSEEILATHLCRPSEGATVKGVNVPAWPWTVYVLLPDDRFWLVVADQDEGERMLAALGRPLDIRTLDKVEPPPSERGRGKRIGILVVGVNLALLGLGLLAAWLVR